MKKWLMIAVVMTGLMAMACQNANIVVIEVTNSDGEQVAFSGFYASDLVDSVNVTGVTPVTYKIDVDPEDDYVFAGFFKTTTEYENELKVELSYMGDVKEVKTTQIPYLPLLVATDIP